MTVESSSTCSVRRGWWSLVCSDWKRRWLQGDLLTNILLHQDDGGGLLTVMQGKGMRGDRYKLKQKVQTGYKEKHIQCDGRQTLRFAQRGFAVSIFRDFPETTGQNPEKCRISEWLCWKGPLKVICSKSPAQRGLPETISPRVKISQPLWAASSSS